MKMQAQLDRKLEVGEELLRLSITGENGKPFTAHFNEMLDLISFVRDLFAIRLETLHNRLLEDHEFSSFFTAEEWDEFREAYETLFHVDGGFNSANTYVNRIGIQVCKETAPSEVTTIELSDFTSLSEVQVSLQEALNFLDHLMMKANEKNLAFMSLMGSMEAEKRLKFNMIFDTLFGRSEASHTEQRLLGDAEERKARLAYFAESEASSELQAKGGI